MQCPSLQVATSLARERIALHTCDQRRARSELQAEFPHVDFGEVCCQRGPVPPHLPVKHGRRAAGRCLMLVCQP